MRYLVLASLVAAIACAPDIDVDEGEGLSPIVEFDPGNSIIPFPNNLLVDPTNGKVNIPEGCNESVTQTALRTLVLNQLNGFGTFKPTLLVTTTEEVDPASVDGNAFLFKRAEAGVPVDPADAEPTPLVAVPTVTARSSADCSSSSLVPALALVPAVPLDPESTYTVALTSGISSTGGEAFQASTTWALVRLADNPVTVDENGNLVSELTPLDPVTDLETILGLNLLWNAHNPALEFLDFVVDGQRGDILAAWDFNTQTTAGPLDATRAESPASELGATPFSSITPIDQGDPEAFIQAQTGACDMGAGGLPCAAVGEILIATVSANNYQTQSPNPIGGAMLQGPWGDPVDPPMIRSEDITAFIFMPAGPGPYKTVVFGHGLTRSRGDLIAIASQFAAANVATVGINWVAHGDRAVQTSNASELGCSGALDPTTAPQCFAPFVSTDLATTRDNVRQSVLDALSLIEAIKACDGNNNCGSLSDFNSEQMGYIGQSLGAIIGTIVVAMSPDIEAAVLNVGAVGWFDIVENSETPGIVCPLVDGLIAAGVVEGTPGETCLTDDWKTQPGYLSFVNIARWILDPAEGANFTARFGARPVMIQKVIGDTVVPNVATDIMAALRGLSAQSADMTVDPSTVSTAVETDPGMPKFIEYTTLPAADPFPGNTYDHGALLAPANGGADGALGTALMQLDAITYLNNNID